MGKGNQQSKLNDVLKVLERLFAEKQAKDGDPRVSDAAKVVGTELSMAPALAATLLQTLHRQKKIGLMNGIGNMDCVVAPEQGMLCAVRAVATSGGRGVKAITPSAPRVSSAYDEKEDVEVAELRSVAAEIAQLQQNEVVLRGKLVTANNKATKARSDAKAAIEAKEKAEAELREARRTIRELEALREEAAKVPELERQLNELRTSTTVSDDIAEVIERLTHIE